MFNVNTVAMYKGAAPFEDTWQSSGKKWRQPRKSPADSPSKYPYQWHHCNSSGTTTAAWYTAQSEPLN
jgi:hypothetical protein